MARTTDALLDQLLRFLPPQAAALSPVLAGLAAQLQAAEAEGEAAAAEVSIDGASGRWLTLLARGYGVTRATDETDASVRARLRNVADRLTPQAILDAANAVLAAYGYPEDAQLVEWFSAPERFADVNAFCDTSRLTGEHNTFFLVVPDPGALTLVETYADTDFADSSFVGEAGAGGEPPVLEALIAEIAQARAAGVRWFLILET